MASTYFNNSWQIDSVYLVNNPRTILATITINGTSYQYTKQNYGYAACCCYTHNGAFYIYTIGFSSSAISVNEPWSTGGGGAFLYSDSITQKLSNTVMYYEVHDVSAPASGTITVNSPYYLGELSNPPSESGMLDRMGFTPNQYDIIDGCTVSAAYLKTSTGNIGYSLYYLYPSVTAVLSKPYSDYSLLFAYKDTSNNSHLVTISPSYNGAISLPIDNAISGATFIPHFEQFDYRGIHWQVCDWRTTTDLNYSTLSISSYSDLLEYAGLTVTETPTPYIINHSNWSICNDASCEYSGSRIFYRNNVDIQYSTLLDIAGFSCYWLEYDSTIDQYKVCLSYVVPEYSFDYYTPGEHSSEPAVEKYDDDTSTYLPLYNRCCSPNNNDYYSSLQISGVLSDSSGALYINAGEYDIGVLTDHRGDSMFLGIIDAGDDIDIFGLTHFQWKNIDSKCGWTTYTPFVVRTPAIIGSYTFNGDGWLVQKDNAGIALSFQYRDSNGYHYVLFSTIDAYTDMSIIATSGSSGNSPSTISITKDVEEIEGIKFYFTIATESTGIHDENFSTLLIPSGYEWWTALLLYSRSSLYTSRVATGMQWSALDYALVNTNGDTVAPIYMQGSGVSYLGNLIKDDTGYALAYAYTSNSYRYNVIVVSTRDPNIQTRFHWNDEWYEWYEQYFVSETSSITYENRTWYVNYIHTTQEAYLYPYSDQNAIASMTDNRQFSDIVADLFLRAQVIVQQTPPPPAYRDTTIKRDWFGAIDPPPFILCKANRERIGELFCLEKKHTFKLNDLDEISFTIPLYRDDERDPEYEYTIPEKTATTPKDEYYDLVDVMRYIELPGIGMFYIDSVQITSEGERNERKQVVAKSLEGILAQRYIELLYVNGYNTEDEGGIVIGDGEIPVVLYDAERTALSLMHYVLEKAPEWTVAYVDPDLKNEVRSFGVDRQDILSFMLNDMTKAFECVFKFDTLNRTISIFKESAYGVSSNVHVSYQNLLKSANMNCDISNIKTCLTITGDDDIDIRNVNYGQDRIYNFDYYNSTAYFSQSLYEAYNNWIDKIDDYEEEYSDLTAQEQEVTANIEFLIHEKMPDPEEQKETRDFTESEMLAFYDIPEPYAADTYYPVLTRYIVYIFGSTKLAIAVKYDSTDNCWKYTIDRRHDYPIIPYGSSSIKLTVLDKDKNDWNDYGQKPLEEKLQSYQAMLDAAQKSGFGDPNLVQVDNYRPYEQIYLPCLNTIKAIKLVLTTITKITLPAMYGQRNTIRAQEEEIINDVSMDVNFTPEQMAELSCFIREEQMSSDDYVVTDIMSTEEKYDALRELKAYGERELAKVAIPQFTYSSSIVNLFADPDFDIVSPNFAVGNYIYVTIRPDLVVKPKILEMTVNYYDPDDFNVTFGNVVRRKDNIFDDVTEALNTASSAATSVSMNRAYWSSGTYAALETTTHLEQGLLNAAAWLLDPGHSTVEIDERGMWINTDDDSPNPGDSIFFGGGRILFTDDDWLTVKTAIGRFTADLDDDGIPEDHFGVLAEAVIAGYIEGGKIVGTDISNGNGTFHVDSNGNLTATSATITGTINATGGTFSGNITATGTITGGTISGATVTGTNITGGTVQGTQITNGNNFSVDANGNMTANNAEITGELSLPSGSCIYGQYQDYSRPPQTHKYPLMTFPEMEASYEMYKTHWFTLGAVTNTYIPRAAANFWAVQAFYCGNRDYDYPEGYSGTTQGECRYATWGLSNTNPHVFEYAVADYSEEATAGGSIIRLFGYPEVYFYTDNSQGIDADVYGVFHNQSDIRYKNIFPQWMSTDISKSIICGLDPIAFEYKNNPGRYYRGFSAQQVQEVLDELDIPEMIYQYKDKEDRYYITQDELIPDLVNCIKDLYAQINDLKEQLNERAD